MTDVLAGIWGQSEHMAPKEAVGILEGGVEPLDHTCVIYDAWEPLVNEAQDPVKHFALYQQQVQYILDKRLKGDLYCLWHSHVDRLPILSEEDQAVMWAIKLPMLVVGLAYRQAVMYSYLAPRPSDGKQAIVQWGKWEKP